MPPIVDEAICIRQWDWSETSQTVSLFTRELGMVRALAKGSKRPKSPYSGGVETLTRASIGVILRPNSDLALLTEWDLIETYPALRRNLAAHNAGLFVADVVGHMVRDHDPHPALYDQTRACLSVLGNLADAKVNPLPGAILKFQWSVLSEAGVAPELFVNVRTGEPIESAGSETDKTVYAFNPSLGGFFDDGATKSAPEGTTWRVRASTLELLRQVARTPDGMTFANAQDVDRANRFLASYLRHVLGTEPPTMGVVFPGRLER